MTVENKNVIRDITCLLCIAGVNLAKFVLTVVDPWVRKLFETTRLPWASKTLNGGSNERYGIVLHWLINECCCKKIKLKKRRQFVRSKYMNRWCILDMDERWEYEYSLGSILLQVSRWLRERNPKYYDNENFSNFSKWHAL